MIACGYRVSEISPFGGKQFKDITEKITECASFTDGRILNGSIPLTLSLTVQIILSISSTCSLGPDISN
jgi:hypothetical protein